MGIVHKDVSLENAMTDGKTAVWTDFGFAIHPSRLDKMFKTLERGTPEVGKPAYVAPEFFNELLVRRFKKGKFHNIESYKEAVYSRHKLMEVYQFGTLARLFMEGYSATDDQYAQMTSAGQCGHEQKTSFVGMMDSLSFKLCYKKSAESIYQSQKAKGIETKSGLPTESGESKETVQRMRTENKNGADSLENIIADAIHPDLKERIQSAREFRERLEKLPELTRRRTR
jgi:serine/threonine protein kinase